MLRQLYAYRGLFFYQILRAILVPRFCNKAVALLLVERRDKGFGQLSICDEGNIHIDCFAADRESVCCFALVRSRRDIDDHVELTVRKQFCNVGFGASANLIYFPAGKTIFYKKICCVFGRKKFEAHACERLH